MTLTNRLLLAGVLVAPTFIGMSLLIAVASPGFSLLPHQLSLLLTGPLGWVQMTNFIVTGLLALACALGVRRALRPGRGAVWGSIAVGAYGIFLIVAAFFHPDPQLGFPAGAPGDVPVSQSAASNLHASAFSLLALAIVAGGFIMARRFAADNERGWMMYSIVNSILIIVLVGAGSVLMSSGYAGLPLFGVALCISFWVSAISLHIARRRIVNVAGPPNSADASYVSRSSTQAR